MTVSVLDRVSYWGRPTRTGGHPPPTRTGGQSPPTPHPYMDVCAEYHIGVSLHGRVLQSTILGWTYMDVCYRVPYWGGPTWTGGQSIKLGWACTDGWAEYHIGECHHGRVVRVSYWGEPTRTGGHRVILGVPTWTSDLSTTSTKEMDWVGQSCIPNRYKNIIAITFWLFTVVLCCFSLITNYKTSIH